MGRPHDGRAGSVLVGLHAATGVWIGGTDLLALATRAWPLTTGLLAAAAGGLVVWRVHAVTPAGARRDWLLLAGWPIGVAVFAALTWLQVGVTAADGLAASMNSL